MSDEELTGGEAVRLQQIRLEKTSRRVAMASFIRGEPSSPEGADDNGTVSFLDLPGGKFLVTNQHVWDTFRAVRTRDASYKLALTGKGLTQPLDISDAELVSENQELDLCVLAYPPERIEGAGKEFCKPIAWPPRRTEEGDDVSITGYPGMRRTPEEMPHPELGEVVSVLWHEPFLLYLRTEATSSRQLRLRFASDNPEVVLFSDRPLTAFRWGGMSGSLVYRLDREQNLYMPCGILHSAGEGLDATFLCAHLDFIQGDGTILGL